LGFRVVMVWECETREVERLTARLAKALADSRGSAERAGWA
jgi:G:T-mismatch repair DNA endonuclease (very short patch repair protein)